jgi:hypothetical protein
MGNLDRRSFLQSSLALGVPLVLPMAMRAAASSRRASVLDFGADLTGQLDATGAVRKAIASLAPSGARLVFPAGKYRFDASEETALQFTGFDGIEIYANDAELWFAGKTMPFGFRGCKDIAIHDMKIDWDQPQGIVKKADAQNLRGREISCFYFEQCEGTLIEGVDIRQAPAKVFVLNGCRDLHMDGVTVAAGLRATTGSSQKVQPLLASGSDALYCRDCHGTFVLKEIRFDGIGGDAVNIYQSYWKIAQRLDDRTVVLTDKDGETPAKWQLPDAGDFVQFSSPSTLALLGEIGVHAVSAESVNHGRGVTLTFSETLSPVIVPGTLVCGVVDAARVRLDHCTIANTLGRGALLHSRAEIVDSHFQGCSREAILLAPDLKTMQGPAVQNVHIRTTTFEDCNVHGDGDGVDRGVIAIDTEQEAGQNLGAGMPNSVVRVQGNTFIRCSSAAIFAAGMDDLVISENTLGHVATGAKMPTAIMLRQVTNAAISNNTSNLPQEIAIVDCAASIECDDNRMLTEAKQG